MAWWPRAQVHLQHLLCTITRAAISACPPWLRGIGRRSGPPILMAASGSLLHHLLVCLAALVVCLGVLRPLPAEGRQSQFAKKQIDWKKLEESYGVDEPPAPPIWGSDGDIGTRQHTIMY